MLKKHSKTIESFDSNMDWHGYNEWWYNDILGIRVTMKHNKEIGYEEWHAKPVTNFYIR